MKSVSSNYAYSIERKALHRIFIINFVYDPSASIKLLKNQLIFGNSFTNYSINDFREEATINILLRNPYFKDF